MRHILEYYFHGRILDWAVQLQWTRVRFLDSEGFYVLQVQHWKDRRQNYLYLHSIYQQFQENSDVYDLVILDVRMPRLSGIQLAKKIREVKKDAKVVIMSAFGMTDDLNSELNEIQLNEFLQKPFHMQKLVSMVEKYIGKRAITSSVHS